MKLLRTEIPDVVIIEPQVFSDERGWFMESFNEPRFHQELKKIGLPIPRPFVQDNHSCSKRGVLRGLHYQVSPHAQGKLVRVLKGAAFDVAVDIREGSETFGKWVGVELSADNQKMLWIPEGFAHGFIALEDDTHFLYKTTDAYNKECERAIKWNDPTLDISWPELDVLSVSEKDNCALYLDAAELSCKSKTFSATSLANLRVIGDHRGSLISIEQGIDIPFSIRRVYYIFDTQSDVARGFHAHRELKQLAVCVSGQCRMILDNGKVRESIWLDAPGKALLIEGMIWREMHDFSEDCVLLVLASEHYNESDYIRDYEIFLKEVNNE